MKRQIQAATLGFLAVVILTPVIWAQPGWIGAVPLGLTPEQQSQIQEMTTKWQAELTPLWTDLHAKGIALQSLLWSANAAPSEVETRSKEYTDLQALIQRKSMELRNSIRGVLTEKQRTDFDQMGLGRGWGLGFAGLGMGGWAGGGFGRGRGFGRGVGRGEIWYQGGYGPGRGRGPCGMGLGRTGFTPWPRRRPW